MYLCRKPKFDPGQYVTYGLGKNDKNRIKGRIWTMEQGRGIGYVYFVKFEKFICSQRCHETDLELDLDVRVDTEI